MTVAQIQLPAKLQPIFAGEAQFRIVWGGRGSGKTRGLATMAAVKGLMCAQAGESGVIVCAREFQNSLADSSMAEVKAAIEAHPFLAQAYEVGEKYIRTKDGRVDFVFLGLRHNVDSIKSLSRIRLLWTDEAENIPEASWIKVVPTVRELGSELWISYNPERKNSATHKRFRENPPANSKFTELNWRDNPWFPASLDAIRRDDEAKRPEIYEHVWEGGFATVWSGAYYAKLLAEAGREGRIGKVSRDPLLPLRAFCDLGGTGARSDAFAVWIGQFVGREIRLLDYYEAVGEPLSVHVQWLRDRGYGAAEVILPHDGGTHDRIYDVSFDSAFRDAGFKTRVIPNQGRGAARLRIEALRRLFPSIWFNEATTEAGREALAWYHEHKSDDHREIGLGPLHDWSSNGSDAAGLMAIVYEMPAARPQKLVYPRLQLA